MCLMMVNGSNAYKIWPNGNMIAEYKDSCPYTDCWPNYDTIAKYRDRCAEHKRYYNPSLSNQIWSNMIYYREASAK